MSDSWRWWEESDAPTRDDLYPPPREGMACRGIMIALALSVALWILIAVVVYTY